MPVFPPTVRYALVLDIKVRGIPVPQGSVKAFVPKGWSRPVLTSTSKNLKTWRQAIGNAVQAEYHGPCLDEPLAMEVTFFLVKPKNRPKTKISYPDTRPDGDKLERACLDSLTGILYRDDARVVRMTWGKEWATAQDPPGVRVKAWTMAKEASRT